MHSKETAKTWPSGIHAWHRRSPQRVSDDSPFRIHLAAEFFTKGRSLEQPGGDKTTFTTSLSLRGKHNPFNLPLLSNKCLNPIFHHLNPMFAQRCLFFSLITLCPFVHTSRS
jgi:hypothetical protein